MNLSNIDKAFIDEVEELSGVNPYACYQCGKCSAGCPFSDIMDQLPSQVIRRVQLGDTSVLESETIWICASCLSCQVTCPKGIDLANLMEGLREINLRRNRDNLDINRLVVEDLPQIALVSNLRKKTS
ncbi:MAG: 4Fe-4S dicluster domain-containing protein [Candidatus Bipolaricaulota bacterium]